MSMVNSTATSLTLYIDGNEANVLNRVGSNVYAFELLTHIELLLRDLPEITTNVLLSAPKVRDLPPARLGFEYEVFGPRQMWSQVALPLYLFSHARRGGVFFTPGHYAPQVCPVPYISSVMDLGFEAFPDYFKQSDLLKLRLWTRGSVARAQKVVAISEFTKAEIASRYNKAPADIVVAPPALSPVPQLSAQQISSTLATLGCLQPYMLYVGTLQPRKNLLTLIAAFTQLKQQTAKQPKKYHALLDSLELVLAGKVGWLADPILDAIKSSPFAAQIKQLGFVDESTKTALYSQARCSVQIGLYEGFGIPVLESLAAGCTPVVATGSSLTEALGDAGVTVNPYKVADVTAGILTVLTAGSKQKSDWTTAAAKQIKTFSWNASASTVLQTILSVGGVRYDK